MHATKLATICIFSLCLGAHLATEPGNALPQQQQSHQHQPLEPHCSLGNDTFQIGERWNPVLDPFGVQVCVLCECTIRQRKSCYETRTTCRKITNECPLIDSCPDGKLPVTIAGQCCKSCVGSTTNSSSSSGDKNDTTSSLDPTDAQKQPNDSSIALVPSVSYNDQTTQSSLANGHLATTSQTSILAFRILYVNEKTNDYLSMVKTLQPCQPRDAEKHTSPAPVKSSKKGRQDLNGFDSKLAFKSLNEVIHLNHAQGSSTSSPLQVSKSSSSPPSIETPAGGSASAAASDMQDHQHPNDVQPTGSEINGPSGGPGHSSSGNRRLRIDGSRGTGGNNLSGGSDRTGGAGSSSSTSAQQPPQTQPNMCTLGNETYSIGDIWHPNLPPLGIQDCVQCNCLFKMRSLKSCYEPIVLCKRLEDECPKIDRCSDGSEPVKQDGSCCSTCPLSATSGSQESDTHIATLSQISLARANSLLSIRKNETTLREFRSMPRAMQSCLKLDNSENWHPSPLRKRKRRKSSSTIRPADWVATSQKQMLQQT